MPKAEIKSVQAGSIAEKYNLQSGDEILSVNNKPVNDYIDFQMETATNMFTITVKKVNGPIKQLKIHRNFNEHLGIEFKKIIFDKLKICTNNCIFCFIEGLPTNTRNSLKIKDDDYRFSFLQGSFITLTNLTKKEFARIKDNRLSPLNISVHTTNPALRRKMMGNKNAGKILKQLSELATAGIKFNTQVVLCPGINDGQELKRTISDLESLYPAVKSLGLVPVGLTKYNNNLKKYNSQRALKLVNSIEKKQNKFKSRYKKNWLYLADEFYLLADKEIPPKETYNNFPQLQNGIGLTRLTRNSFSEIKSKLPARVKEKYVGLITSTLGKKALKPVLKSLKKIQGLTVDIIVVKNTYLGKSVTVTGLLAGHDIYNALAPKKESGPFLIPQIVLNENKMFIDSMHIETFKDKLSQKQIHFISDITEILEVVINE